MSKIERWSVAEVPERALAASLHKIFQVGPDDFWAWHWTFKSVRLPRPQPLLGEARVTDLAVNVVLPWLWIRAHEGGNRKILAEMERRYLAWPAGEDNSVLKHLARQRLLGTANPHILKRATHGAAGVDHANRPRFLRAFKRDLRRLSISWICAQLGNTGRYLISRFANGCSNRRIWHRIWASR